MSDLRGPDRSEVQPLPPCLDDYVAPNAPARFIDAYVQRLDFQALGFTHAQPAANRPGLGAVPMRAQPPAKRFYTAS